MSKLEPVFDHDHAAQYDQQFTALYAVKDALHLAIDIAFEGLGANARLLVVGAGTGQEIVALGKRRPNWKFVAVDPSEPMLDMARRKLSEQGMLDRCILHVGTLDTLPTTEDFDAATAILVSHFFTEGEERRAFLKRIAGHLRLGGQFFLADLSADIEPTAQAEALVWWARALGRAMSEEGVTALLQAYGRDVALSTPPEVSSYMTESGLTSPVCVYQFGLIRGWQAQRKPPVEPPLR
ncbi:MAG: class I SAM-dependent methyltransferase [Myxococcota bacterium]